MNTGKTNSLSFNSGSQGHRPASAVIPHLGGAMGIALMGSLAFTSVCTKRAEAFENNKEFLWNKMLSCQSAPKNCQEVRNPNPQKLRCVSAATSMPTRLLTEDCDASYVISLPDGSGRHLKQTLLIPGSGSSPTTGATIAIPNYPVSGIEAYKSTDATAPPNTKWHWLPNYFAFAASFALNHYRGVAGANWVVVSMNSANTRTQDQLHLHMCNFNPDIVKMFLAHPPMNQDDWENTGFKVENLLYYVMKLSNPVKVGDPLSNPFTKVFTPEAPTGGVGGVAPSKRADVTLALVISPSPMGTNYLLYNIDGGAAESLLPQNGKPCDYKP